MSRLTTGLLGAIALSLVSGAAQLALGRDFPLKPTDEGTSMASPNDRPPSFQPQSSGTASFMVNRVAKSDRAMIPSGPTLRTRTVLLRLDSFADTSFVLRIPMADASSSQAPAKSDVRKSVVACEPVVSVLTEVAKQLQPGRCVA